MIKVDKEELYKHLMEQYSLTLQEVVTMNPYQQYILSRGPRVQTFGSMDELPEKYKKQLLGGVKT